MLHKLAVGWLLCLSLTGWGQRLSVEKFVGDVPLPSAELYDIAEDQQGHKWIASELGVFKLTGNHLEHFTTANGLAENVVLRFHEGLNGRLWLVGLSGTLMSLHRGRFSTLRTQPAIESLTPKNRFLLRVAETAPGQLIFTRFNNKAWYTARNGTLTEHPYPAEQGFALELLDHKQYLMKTPVGPRTASRYALTIRTAHESYTYPKLFTKPLVQDILWRAINDSTDLLCHANEVVVFRRFRPIGRYTLPNDILSVKQVGADTYLGTRFNGLYTLAAGQLTRLDVPVLNRLSISDILPDREGNIWFTTLEKGLYVCRMTRLQSFYQGETNIIRLLDAPSQGQALLADNQLLRLPNSQPQPLLDKALRVHDIILHGQTPIYLTAIGPVDSRTRQPILNSRFFVTRHVRLGNNRYALLGNANVCIIELGQRTHAERPISDRIICLAALGPNEVWAGTANTGIRPFRLTPQPVAEPPLLGNARVNCILPLNDTLVGIGTNDRGVLLINRRGTVVDSLPGLPQRIECLTYHQRQLYVGTRQGLFIHDFATRRTRLLNSTNFLPFDEVVDVQVRTDGRLYVAGKYELIALPIADLNRLCLALTLSTTGLSHPLQKGQLTVTPGDLLSLTCVQTNYKAAPNVRYHFALTDAAGKVVAGQATAQRSFQTKAEPGRYTLTVRAVDTATLSESNQLRYSLWVPTPFYRAWWFVGGCALAGLGLLGLGTRRIVQNVRATETRKRLTERRINQLEAKALQVQMNPHFIFNAMNSIQAFIKQNKTDQANYYLTEFAQLIRMILNNSQKRTVPLQAEIDLLNAYVELEAQRLKQPVDFQVDLGDDIDSDSVEIPPMLLQPIVENAIWHGLQADRQQPCLIRLSVERTHDRLLIRVFNSGKPYNPAPLRDDGARGLQLVKERIALLYRDADPDSLLRIENVASEYTPGKSTPGVAVQFALPFDA